jgi:hypothetical protein
MAPSTVPPRSADLFDFCFNFRSRTALVPQLEIIS